MIEDAEGFEIFCSQEPVNGRNRRYLRAIAAFRFMNRWQTRRKSETRIPSDRSRLILLAIVAFMSGDVRP
jgi:hypothetical protein